MYIYPVIATLVCKCIYYSCIYIILLLWQFFTFCEQRPICMGLVKYVSDRGMYSCFDMYLWILVLYPTGKEKVHS